MKKLSENMQNLFWERIDQAITESKKQSREYALLDKQRNAYLAYLNKSFTAQMRRVYLRWEGSQGMIASYENLWAYQQGLEDGIRLVQEIQLSGNR